MDTEEKRRRRVHDFVTSVVRRIVRVRAAEKDRDGWRVHSADVVCRFWRNVVPGRRWIRTAHQLLKKQQHDDLRDYAARVIQRSFHTTGSRAVARGRRQDYQSTMHGEAAVEELMYREVEARAVTLQRLGRGHLSRDHTQFLKTIRLHGPILMRFMRYIMAKCVVSSARARRIALYRSHDIAEKIEFAEYNRSRLVVLQRVGRGLLDRKFTSMAQLWKASSCTIQRWLRTKVRRRRIMQRQKLEAELVQRQVHIGAVPPKEGQHHMSTGTQQDPTWLDWLDAAPQRRTVYQQTVHKPIRRRPSVATLVMPQYDVVAPTTLRRIPTRAGAVPPLERSTSPMSGRREEIPAQSPPAGAKEGILRQLYYANIRQLGRMSLHGLHQMEQLLANPRDTSGHDMESISDNLSRTQQMDRTAPSKPGAGTWRPTKRGNSPTKRGNSPTKRANRPHTRNPLPKDVTKA